jgi:hypothetical protein
MSLEVWQVEIEQKVLEYKSLLEDGDLNQSEYEELVEDLVDLSKIDADLELEENKILAQKIIDGVKLIAGLIK